jgi:MFS family permease
MVEAAASPTPAITGGGIVVSTMDERVTFTDVLRVREFRNLWIADAQSMAGDQLARVALSVLVFERTASSALTALTYALTFLPALLGGALLSGLADRFPRKKVLVVCDLVRAVLLGLMAIPGLPLRGVCALLVLAVLVGSPFSAAESALVPDILEGERYLVGTGVRTITNQIAQLAGFACGGLVIAAIGPRAGLAIDAGTFVLSSLLIFVGVRSRSAPTAEPQGKPVRGYGASIIAGARYVLSDSRLRTLLGLSWLAGLYVVPEGVAPPYAADFGGGPSAVGLLMAASPAGTALGTYIFVRLIPAGSRSRWMGPLAIATGLPLAACAASPGLGLSLALWLASGICMAYQIEVVARYIRAVPSDMRGSAVGVASSGLTAIQGLGVLLGGIVAGQWGAGAAVALAGGSGALLAGCLTIRWSRITGRSEFHVVPSP